MDSPDRKRTGTHVGLSEQPVAHKSLTFQPPPTVPPRKVPASVKYVSVKIVREPTPVLMLSCLPEDVTVVIIFSAGAGRGGNMVR